MTLHVIVPVYNGSRYISEALHSILDMRGHTPFSTRIVLINDGSSDNTEEICKSFVNQYPGIDYLYQENMGVSAARNTGLHDVFEHCAPDDWIGFLDADDAWHPEWTSALERCQDSKADIIGFGMAFANERLEMRGGSLLNSV